MRRAPLLMGTFGWVVVIAGNIYCLGQSKQTPSERLDIFGQGGSGERSQALSA
jgi:hypothetical protein